MSGPGTGTAPTSGPPDQGEVCLTCGDVAVELTVVELDGSDAICQAEDGGRERVAVELVGPTEVGDRLLVHAAVAIARVG